MKQNNILIILLITSLNMYTQRVPTSVKIDTLSIVKLKKEIAHSHEFNYVKGKIKILFDKRFFENIVERNLLTELYSVKSGKTDLYYKKYTKILKTLRNRNKITKKELLEIEGLSLFESVVLELIEFKKAIIIIEDKQLHEVVKLFRYETYEDEEGAMKYEDYIILKYGDREILRYLYQAIIE